MEPEIIIRESFSDESDEFFDKIEKKNFDSKEIMELKIEAEEVSQDNEIKELLSYESIKKSLEYDLPHQREGALKILRDLNGSGLLADEVGLGKTVTAGIALRECIERGLVKNTLILTPPSLVDQWVAELKEKFNLDFKIIEKEEDWGTSPFVIASLDRVKIQYKDTQIFKHDRAHNISWDLLIVDEAHKLKDKNTVRWEFVDKLKKKRFLILTATPFQNDLFELYNLLNLLKRGHLGTIQEFKKQFLHRGNKRHPLNPNDLKRRLDEVMVRRRRDQTKVSYRKRIPKIVPVELSQEEYRIYDSICDLLKTKYLSANGNEINGRLVIFAILPKITSSSRSAMESLKKIVDDQKYHQTTREIASRILSDYRMVKKDSKIEKLVELVGNILKEEKDAKMLIYTKHPTTLRYIVEKLQPFNLKIVEYLGGLDREEKSEIVKKFKEEAQIMLSTETGSEGLNFQFCHILINYDLPWNPMAVEQRIGRLDRIGQKSDMQIYSLATKKTIEEHVVDLIINKMCCIGLVIGELPIILFNLGLDERGTGGVNKIEEMLMNAFIDSKNNLDIFASEVEKIAEMLEKGMEDYKKAKTATMEVLDKNEGTGGA
ncbi:DEAD/DEAH box helicase [Candidatus Pacearchaeota archaeon]|nr:DEAD/DEAH box helicase [Candidatus Pacearchaeota archaeon]